MKELIFIKKIESKNHKEIQTNNQYNIKNVKSLIDIVSKFLESVYSINDSSLCSSFGSQRIVVFEFEELDLNMLQKALEEYVKLIKTSRHREEEIKSLIKKNASIEILNEVIKLALF